MKELISVSHAEATIQENLPVLPSCTAPLLRAAGSVLAAPIYTKDDLPPYDRVLMDGVAFCSTTTTRKILSIKGILAAGEKPTSPLRPNEAWRINTGAVLPPDCDTVVPVEQLEIDTNLQSVTLMEAKEHFTGKHVHEKGSDRKRGDLLLPEGTLLNSVAVSAAVSQGALEVEVIRKPCLFLLTTGQEVVAPHETPTGTQIRQSHYHTLATAAQREGLPPLTHLHLPDDRAAIEAQLSKAFVGPYDLIMTCGGISRGTGDYLAPVLRALVGPPLFHGVAQRPGKPFAFWLKNRDQFSETCCASTLPVFALPGNALSALVTFHRYVLPAARQMAGHSGLVPQSSLTLHSALEPTTLTRFLPVQRLGGEEGELMIPQNSGDFANAALSDGFVEIPPHHTGKRFEFYPWS